MVRVWLSLVAVFVTGLGLVASFSIGLSQWLQPSLPRLLFSNNQTRTLYLWQADCSSLFVVCQQEHPLLTGLYVHPVVQWSPDGKFIAVSMLDGWLIYPADCLIQNKTCIPTPLDPLATDTRIAWANGGSAMAYMTGDTTLTIRTRGCWDRDSTQTCLTHSIRIAPGGVYQQPDWSADGQWLVFLGVQPQGLVVLSASCLDVREGCSDTLKSLGYQSLAVVLAVAIG